MEFIQINEEQLEYYRELSEDLCDQSQKLIYMEYNKENKAILILIKHGKYVDYFTHAEVIISKNIVINDLKMIKKYNPSKLNLEILKQKTS